MKLVLTLKKFVINYENMTKSEMIRRNKCLFRLIIWSILDDMDFVCLLQASRKHLKDIIYRSFEL